MRSIRLIRILASFPNDVFDEAERLDAVAQRLNTILGDSQGVRIEIVRWDRNVHAGVGNDLQDVVNVQVGDDYDIVVATFWGRAGTPTPRAESGSIEEVKTALSRRKRTGAPQVLVYMKTAGLDPLSVDPIQLQSLKSFREWLGAEGVLYKTFEDSLSYESLVLVELSQVVTELSVGGGHAVAISTQEDLPAENGLEEEWGFFDYIDNFQSSSEKMRELMDEQTAALNRLTEHNQNSTKEIESANNQAIFRRVLKKSAEAWNHYCDTTEKRLVGLEKVTDDAFQAMASAVAMGASSDSEEEEEGLRDSLNMLLSTLGDSTASTRNMRDTTAEFPRLTVEHNRAKRRLVAVLDKQIAYLEKTHSFVQEISRSLE